jgi:cell division protein FtsB
MAAAHDRVRHSQNGEAPSFLMKWTKVNLCLLLTLVIPFCVFAFRPPVRQEIAEREKLAKIEERRDELLAEKSRLRRKIDLISRDPDYLEVIARDKLQMQKDGELVFRFED